ncbi:CsbD family protein [Pseudahrensia aquimaris]|uniref:CsbD family protein n=1 Tax=Pseudahrensia aquimaris TaxID=744461 RepID=A0ABW3FHX8_9HYPH
MQFEEFEVAWPELIEEAAERWRRLTRLDIQAVQSDMDQLIDSVAERYGKRRSEAEKEVYEWIVRQRSPAKKRASG